MAPNAVAIPLLLYGTEQQRKDYLPKFCDVGFPKATAAVIEPSIRFDVNRPQTTATANGDGFVLNGEKAYVPLASDAEMVLVYATDSEAGKVDAYIVEQGTDGLQVGEREKLMGIRSLETYRVKLNNCKVAAACKLGGDEGADAGSLLAHSRVAIAALAVGLGRAAFEYSRDYAKEREQFGVPIATKQAIAFLLADMAIEVDAARLMMWEAAWLIDQGQGAQKQALPAQAAQYQNHTTLAVDALNSGSLPGGKLHAEHTINIIEGRESENYDDWNGDGRTENPGDEVGLAPYLLILADAAHATAVAPDTPDDLRQTAQDVASRATALSEIAFDASTLARRLTAADTVEEAQALIIEITGLRDTIIAEAEALTEQASTLDLAIIIEIGG